MFIATESHIIFLGPRMDALNDALSEFTKAASYQQQFVFFVYFHLIYL